MSEHKELIMNARFPKGHGGVEVLERMSESHTDVTTWALELLDPQPCESILDIGCGGGRALHRVSAMDPSLKLYGVDYSDVAIDCATRENSEDILSGKLTLTQGSVSDLPYKDGSFDKVYSIESYYFWPDLENDLKEVRRVLSDGGRAFIVADIHGRDGLDQHTVDTIELLHMTNLTFEEFETVMKKAGFKNVIIHGKEGTEWMCAEGTK